MAFDPCDAHGARYRGPSQAAYPAIVDGGESERRHLRLCPPCFTEYIGEAAEKLDEVIVGARARPDDLKLCYLCKATQCTTRLFITLYPSKADERQFFGFACFAHVGAARATWLLAETA